MKPTQTELLLLPDGRILVHNLTLAMAAVLHHLDPQDRKMKQRACRRALGPADLQKSPKSP